MILVPTAATLQGTAVAESWAAFGQDLPDTVPDDVLAGQAQSSIVQGANLKPSTSASSFRDRLAGALLLKPSAYEGLKGDPGAWDIVCLVIVAVALAHGWGAVLRSPSQGYAEPTAVTFLFGFMGELLLWFGMSAAIFGGARMLSERRVSFGEVARPLGFAAAPGIAVVLAGAVSAAGRSPVPLLVVMGTWRLAASYVAVREGLAVSSGKAAAWLSAGLVGGLGLMGAGAALLNNLSSR